MIVHIVMFQPRGDLDATTRETLLEEIATAAKTIPSVRRMRVGPRARHGSPGYEQAMTTDYGYALIAEFDDREGLVAYLKHPAHRKSAGTSPRRPSGRSRTTMRWKT